MKYLFLALSYVVVLIASLLATLFMSGVSTILVADIGMSEGLTSVYVALSDSFLKITVTFLFILSIQGALKLRGALLDNPSTTVRTLYVRFLERVGKGHFVKGVDSVYEFVTVVSQLWFVLTSLVVLVCIFMVETDAGVVGDFLMAAKSLGQPTKLLTVSLTIASGLWYLVWYILFPCSKRSGELLDERCLQSESYLEA
ncbi:hypothetical protein [Vibrio crassostreae]|uniref:hypothetical protein n=1 Tax=Vibrio crassostreae TaxID=246167 RepID=UPI001B30DFFC|nr:hypothetical protein [Vibrio crassostreae]